MLIYFKISSVFVTLVNFLHWLCTLFHCFFSAFPMELLFGQLLILRRSQNYRSLGSWKSDNYEYRGQSKKLYLKLRKKVLRVITLQEAIEKSPILQLIY